MKKILFLFIIAAIFCDAAVYAVSFDDLDSELNQEVQWLQKENTIYSATKTVETIDKVPASVTVITKKDIKNMGARDIYDILKNVPGLGVSLHRIGYIKTEARGFATDNNEKLLFLLNGHPLNEPFSGGLNNIYHRPNVESVQRIEVVRGPSSALFGAGAVLGVINIITDDQNDSNRMSAKISYGSYDTMLINLKGYQSVANMDLFLNVNNTKTAGWNPFINANSGAISGNINAGYNNFEIDGSVKIGDLKYTTKYLSSKQYGLIGLANTLTDDNNVNVFGWTNFVTYDFLLMDSLNMTSSAWYDYTNFKNTWELVDNTFSVRSDIEMSKTGAELQGTVVLNDQNKIIAGVSGELQRQFLPRIWWSRDPVTFADLGGLTEYSSTRNWTEEVSRSVLALYGQEIFDFSDDIRMILGARYDTYSDFGGSLNPRMGIVYRVVKGMNLKINYGTAFRAPAYNEMYNKNNPSLIGNTSIKPETINTLELGLNGKVLETDYSFVYFNNTISNTITQVLVDSATNTYQFQNTDDIKSWGVEVDLKYHLNEQVSLGAKATYTDSKTNEGNYTPYIPRGKALGFLNAELNEYANVYFDGYYMTSVPYPDTSKAYHDGYLVFNSNVRINGSLYGIPNSNINLRISNLLDTQYSQAEVIDIPQAGREILLSVGYDL